MNVGAFATAGGKLFPSLSILKDIRAYHIPFLQSAALSTTTVQIMVRSLLAQWALVQQRLRTPAFQVYAIAASIALRPQAA